VSDADELREAVENARAWDESHITLRPGAYVLDSYRHESLGRQEGQLVVDAKVIITGGPNTSITIGPGPNAGAVEPAPSRHFYVTPDGDLTLDGVTLYDGGTGSSGASTIDLEPRPLEGGAILNEGALTVRNTLLRDNDAADKGGAIANYGTMTLSDVTLRNNTCLHTGGCAIYNAQGATARITRGLLEHNGGHKLVSGHAVLNEGTMMVNAVTMRENALDYVQGEGWVPVTDPERSRNLWNWDTGRVTLRNSTFIGSPESFGGGIRNDGPPDRVRDEGGNEFRP
jgi:hypothetical protein